jgi:hypothetical protein
MIAIETPDPNVRVFDDVLADPDGYRALALSQPYDSYTLGAATFHGISFAPPLVSDLIRAECGFTPTLTFFRKSPKGQTEPHYIHSDRSMGDWTALLYLTPDPPKDDGTIFWESLTGDRADTSQTLEDYIASGAAWNDKSQWQPWYRVAAKFNRLVLFDAPYYHSRALVENYGEDAGARLVNVTFGSYS